MHQADVHDSRTSAPAVPRRTRGTAMLMTVPLAVVPSGALALAIFVLRLDTRRWILAALLGAFTFALIPILGYVRRRGR